MSGGDGCPQWQRCNRGGKALAKKIDELFRQEQQYSDQEWNEERSYDPEATMQRVMALAAVLAVEINLAPGETKTRLANLFRESLHYYALDFARYLQTSQRKRRGDKR